jgi:hypothetical protein
MNNTFRARKAVLEYLGFDHAYLTGARNSFCSPLEMGADEWTLSTDADMPDGNAVLHIKYKGEYIELPVALKKQSAGVRVAAFLDKPPSSAPLFAGIREMLADESRWNSRREDRRAVGVDGSAGLGLSSPEQRLFFGKREYPCLVNNVSFGGMSLTCPADDGFKEGGELIVRLSFASPIENIPLRCWIQSVSVKTGAAKTPTARPPRFAVMGLQFIDPPLSFKQRLGRLLEPAGGEGYNAV